MKTNFKDLSDAELNKVAGEACGWKLVPTKQCRNYENEKDGLYEHRHYLCWVDSEGSFKFFKKYHDFDLCSEEVFNPANDLNQINDYLFPLLREKAKESGGSFDMKTRMDDGIFTCIIDYHAPIKTIVPAREDFRIKNSCCITDDPTKIKRTILETCLEAVERINNDE